MKPPYEISPRIIEMIASISEKIGEVNSAYLFKPPTELRRKNRIKTIQSSLEIEGNSLSLDQVTAILDNTATASRDLKNAVDKRILIKTGDKRITQYRFKKQN